MAFSEILEKRGCCPSNTVRSLLVNCRKVLYGKDGLQMRVGMPADLAVFPSSGRGPAGDLTDPQDDTVMTVLGRTVR
jgi:hypothetical protein